MTADSLVQCLIEVRRALGDEAQNFIKTVPRRGYIFDIEVSEDNASTKGTVYQEAVAGVHIVIEEAEETNGHGAIETAHVQARGSHALAAPHQKAKVPALVGASKLRWRTMLLAPAALIVIGAGGAAWRLHASRAANQNTAIAPVLSAAMPQFQTVEMTDLTRTGNIVNNAISADGQYAVYTTVDAGRESLWLRQLTTDSAYQLIPPAAARYYGVSFSRDGSHIFYLRAENTQPKTNTL